MPQLFYDRDADPSRLQNLEVAILGFGSQGHAHALNLRESGVSVIVGLPASSRSRAKALEAGLEVLTPAEATARARVIMVLAPDTAQAALYERDIAPNLEPGDTLMFAHGFNIRYRQIVPPAQVDVAMVAPKAPGHRVRELYQEGAGTPALLAIEQDATGQAQATALAYARALGCTRAGVLATTFAEETETDLFGEQAVLCGGMTALVRAGFETLVEAGYQPEVAYFECLHELKLIVDLMYRGGLQEMWHSVSDTAEHGGYEGGSRLVGDQVRQEMRSMLDDIRSGDYADRWIDENRRGRETFDGRRASEQGHPIEAVGRRLRSMMSFLAAPPTAAPGPAANVPPAPLPEPVRPVAS
ncbi:MAG: ketol-acid reductoisomerase [Acidobacteriota bacterium]